jgi:GLPGLI family protein
MKALLSIILLLTVSQLRSQTVFQPTVKIEYEKVVYVKQLYKTLEPEWYEMLKDRLPETSMTYYDFIGDTSRSVFKPGREVAKDNRVWYSGLADKNVVYNDYHKNTTITQKPIFEETFLVEDSLMNIKWKITADTRNIAGFECRKAIGIISDTIAVFAFYTDEILINGGPESIHGLPGMILGVGVPRLHTTWFATKVEVNGVPMNQVKPETKGKKVTRQTMLGSLDNVLKQWGQYGKNMILNFVI